VTAVQVLVIVRIVEAPIAVKVIGTAVYIPPFPSIVAAAVPKVPKKTCTLQVASKPGTPAYKVPVYVCPAVVTKV